MHMKNLYQLIFLWLAAMLVGPNLKAQQPPALGGCFLLQASSEVAAPGETVCVKVSAKDFDGILSSQFSMEWDATKLQFERVDLPTDNPLGLAANVNFGTTQTTAGKLMLSWPTPTSNGVTVPDGATLFSVCFRVIGSAGQSSQFRFSGSPVPFETVNDQLAFLPFNQIVGGVRIGGNPVVSDLSLASACTAPSGCTGQSGAVDITPTGGQPPYQFLWSGNFGFTATTEDLSNIGPGVYFLNLTDAAGTTVKAQFVVQPSSSSATIFDADISPAKCPASDGAIDLSVSSLAMPLNYVWSNGANTQDISGLAPGDYGVTVIDAQGCVVFRDFTVGQTTDIALTSNVEFPDCDGSPVFGSIVVTAAGGVPPYTYLWSNGWTVPTVTDLTPGEYLVHVTDAQGCVRSEKYFVEDYTTQAWDVATINYCKPDSSGDIVAVVYAAPGIEAPVTYSWSNGVKHIRNLWPGSYAFRDTLFGVPSGQYALTVSDAGGCSKVLNIVLDCVGQPGPGQCFALEIASTQADPGDLVCLPVKVKGFQDILSQQFTLTWDTAAVQFVEVKNFNALPNLSLPNFNVLDNGAGKLAHSWFDPLVAGVDLADETAIFDVCFLLRPDAPGNSTTISFNNVPVPIEVSSSAGILQNFAGFEGTITWDDGVPPLKLGACTSTTDCSNDGKASLRLFVDGTIMPYTVQWEKNGQVTSGQASDLVALDPGLYRVTVTDLTGVSARGVFNFPKLADSECVWPGDADNNNAVNHFDLLYMGLGFGKTGPVRGSLGTAWTGHDGADWAQATPNRAVNFKNFDADGDGKITLNDTAAIAKNWGQVIRPIYDNPEAAPFTGGDPTDAAPLFVQSDTLAEGQSATLTVALGTAAQPMTDVYGVAFSLDYDPKVLKEGRTHFAPTASWLGAPNELLVIQRDFHEKGRMDIAITRRDGQAIPAGFGALGSLYIVIEDDIFALKGGLDEPEWVVVDTLKPTIFTVSRVRSINAAEQERSTSPRTTTVQIRQKFVGTRQPGDLSHLLQISPNPVSDALKITVPGEQIEQIEVVSAAGASLKRVAGLGAQSGLLQTSDLPNGTYFLKILTANGFAARQFAVLR